VRSRDHPQREPADTGGDKRPTAGIWRLCKEEEAHQAKQEGWRGDNRHHQQEPHDFMVIEPAVEAAVHVRSIVISLWPAYAGSAREAGLLVNVGTCWLPAAIWFAVNRQVQLGKALADKTLA